MPCLQHHRRFARTLAVSVWLASAFAVPLYAGDATLGGHGELQSAPGLLPDPAQSLARMAGALDHNPGFVVATVAGQAITRGDLADAIRAMPVSLASLGYQALYARAMDQLLRLKLTVASAEKAGVAADPVVRRREKTAADQVLGEAWLERAAGAAVTDTALHARYASDIAGKPGPEEVRLRVILVPTASEANELIGKLHAGADFADLARHYSKDLSAAAGGDIGYVPLAALGAEVGAVAFALPPGEVTAYPVRALPGYFVLRVEGRRRRATPSFDAARPVLANALRREAAAAALNALTADIKLEHASDAGAQLPEGAGKQGEP